MSTQVPYSGCSVPSMMPGFSRNWRRTSSTTAAPARPTACMQSEANRNGIAPPISRPTTTQALPRSKSSADGLPASASLCELVAVRREQHQRGEAGRADRVALRDGLGGVADGVERVGDVARTSSGRFAISAMPPALSVTGPNASSAMMTPAIEQHRHDRERDAGQAGELVWR